MYFDFTGKSCGSPPVGSRASRSTSSLVRFPNSVVYSCFAGYVLVSGDLNRTCQANMTFSGTTPQCNSMYSAIEYFLVFPVKPDSSV